MPLFLQAPWGLALPVLEDAAERIEFGVRKSPVVVADYGSSQGKNSLVPMRIAIKTMRKRLGSDEPVFVFHIDQPTNDFNTLFGVLDAVPDKIHIVP